MKKVLNEDKWENMQCLYKACQAVITAGAYSQTLA